MVGESLPPKWGGVEGGMCGRKGVKMGVRRALSVPLITWAKRNYCLLSGAKRKQCTVGQSGWEYVKRL